jgi:hypothetical protein
MLGEVHMTFWEAFVCWMIINELAALVLIERAALRR